MKFVKYVGVTILVALCLALAISWSLWAVLFLVVTAYGVNALRVDHPHLAKWLGVAVVIVLVSGWAWSNFKGNFPLSYTTLPYGRNQADNQISKLMDPGLSKARTVLALELRKKEDKLAADIPALMQAGNYGQVKTNTQELIDLRKDIEKLLVPMAPEPPAKSGVTSYTINQDEVISTLSVPNDSTVYIEADKAFCILEKYGVNDDGSEKLSKLTIHPGKSSRYFTWGGRLRVVGLFNNTTVKLHL